MKQQIISFTPGIKEATERAQKQANQKREPYGIWEHVGLYGYPEGDIPALHTFSTRPLSTADPHRVWALVATVDPK